MTYMTHRQFAVFWALAGTIIIYMKGLTEINYYLALMIVIPIAKVGAEFPDYDHAWQNVKNKTVPSWIINKMIHITGGKHRSWQTHSLDIVICATILSYFLPNKLYELGYISIINKEVLNIIMVGFSLGWLSHLFLDMLTSGKIRLFCFSKFKIGFVPRKIFKLKFNTGGEWEQFVYTVTKILNILVGIVVILFPLIYTGKLESILGSLKFLKKG